MRRTVIGIIAAAALTLSACGSGDDTPSSDPSASAAAAVDPKSTSLDDIEVTGEPGEKPEVAFEAPLAIEEPGSKVLSEGDGAVVEDGQQVTANMTLVSGTDGSVIESSYDAERPAGFPADKDSITETLYDAVVGQKIGSRILLSINGAAAAGQPQQTLVYVIDLLSAEKLPEPLSRAEGEEQPPVEGMPEVTRDDSGKPSISQPEGDAPAELKVEPTIVGDGPEVAEGQNVTVNYTGWLWTDASKPFDSSWDRGEPFVVEGVPNAPVIDGWNEALVGQKVGSQILIVIPPDKGYGEQGSPPNIPGGATLVFVVDILAASGGS